MNRGASYWTLTYAALFAMAAYNLTPFFWMITTSLKTDMEVTSFPPTLLPAELTTGAYARIWSQEGFPLYFLNSIKVSGATALLSGAIGILAAYGFSRFAFKGRTVLMAAFLASQMLPGVLLVGPYFKMLSALALYDTHLGLILAQTTITLPFTIWMLKGYMDTIPVEIDQAAMIDGATRWQCLIHCVLPNILPGLVATMIFSFLLAWGDLLWALCLITDSAKQTMTLGITNLVGQFRVLWSDVMAATVIGCAIPAFFYLLLQRYLVQGSAGSAVKS
ncbi:carbohydrate ABC transporter permease [Bosea rubneri]|uniref:Carbohydrate ABC transporter permease n=1 Tax=Bosea rubneri TaxID=3075434 RepID=A0ABU3S1N6_9HYPH|nr:carbohydrate ABC transporter permease [Bosea sp. ZW T0_25]MDU0338703.1 carbohydrate ABC transporter permease [Bosea sp. ZW T0_25]